MEKERNLKKDKKIKDEYEVEVETKGHKLAAILMFLLATFYYCYEIITGKGENYSIYSLITIYCAFFYGYRAIKLDKNRGLYVFCAVTWGILTIITIMEYFG